MTDDEMRKTLSAKEHEPAETPTRESRDRDSIRLVGTAVLVILIGGAAFLAADTYDINVAWVFLSWNSIWLFVVLRKGFRRHFKNAKLTAFFLLWMDVHGTVVVLAMRWVHMLYWIPIMALELFVGFLAADLLFGIRPDLKRNEALGGGTGTGRTFLILSWAPSESYSPTRPYICRSTGKMCFEHAACAAKSVLGFVLSLVP